MKELTRNRALFTVERRQLILRLLEEHRRLTLGELRAHLGVSDVTIRKDLLWLEGHGALIRTHGGAILAGAAATELSFQHRERLQATEKDRIGRAAAASVAPGTTIFLDASTTAFALARHLPPQQALTVVTTSLQIGRELARRAGTTVLMPGGQIRPESLSLVGDWGIGVVQTLHMATAFVSAYGFTLEEGLTEVNGEEVALKRAIIASAKSITAIIDHTKWGQVALATFCPAARLQRIITDTAAPAAQVALARAQGIEIHLV